MVLNIALYLQYLKRFIKQGVHPRICMHERGKLMPTAIVYTNILGMPTYGELNP